MILTDDQLVALTDRQRADAQRRELDFLDIPYRVRRDGSIVVLLADLPARGTTIEPAATPEPELQP